jgi:hypothetical protein
MFPFAFLWEYDSERNDDGNDDGYDNGSSDAYDPGVSRAASECLTSQVQQRTDQMIRSSLESAREERPWIP